MTKVVQVCRDIFSPPQENTAGSRDYGQLLWTQNNSNELQMENDSCELQMDNAHQVSSGKRQW